MSVILRKRLNRDGTKYTLYLDTHIKGQPRMRDTSIGMFLYKKPKNFLQKRHNADTQAQAEELAATRQLQLQAQNTGVNYAPVGKTSFETFFTTWAAEDKTPRVAKSALLQFKIFNGGKPFMLTQSYINQLKKFLTSGAQLKGGTPFVYIHYIFRAAKAAYKKRVVKTDPTDFDWSIKYDEALTKSLLTDEDVQKLALAPCINNDYKRLFLFCCNTGLRYLDAARLTWADIPNNQIGIRQGKTKKFVRVNLNKNALAMAGTPGKLTDYIFQNVNRTFNGTVYASYPVRKWGEKAGVPATVTTHMARHYFCTTLMKKGVDFRTIIGLMGWSEKSGPQNIARYAHLIDTSMKAAVETIPNFNFETP